MAPGDIASLSQSSRLAFRILINTQQLPPRHELYWRAMTLEHYDGQRWYAAPENQQRIAFQANAQLQGMDYQYLAADTHVEWIMGLEKSVPVSEGLHLQPDWGIRLNQQDRKNKLISLRWIQTGDWQRSVQSQQQGLQRNLGYAENFDLQAQALAEKLYQQSAQDPHRYIENLLQWYQQQGFQYSLTSGRLNQHHIDDFLFNRKVGFCEHYASSFAMLMRYVGIPARVVVGYQGGQAALDRQSWEVRQLDAHAWTEVWLNQQWQRIDPTAMIVPERIDLGMQDLLGQDQGIWGEQSVFQSQQFYGLKQLRIWTDYAAFQWQSKVVGYDQARQMQWLSQLGISSPLQLALLLIATIFVLIGVYAAWLYGHASWRNRGYKRYLAQFNLQLQPEQQKQPSVKHMSYGYYVSVSSYKAKNSCFCNNWPSMTDTIVMPSSH